ncbi:MAG TPA: universal stress protein [Bradyrhizobium sp.]|nr:universal stress protein [Bradyrhizobium sp.]
MPIKDILLPLVGEPDDRAIAAIEKCVAVAGDFAARIEALAVEEDVSVRPTVALLASDDGVAAGLVRSATDARGLLRAFDDAAVRFGVRNVQDLRRLPADEIAPTLARQARLKDLSLVPVKANSNQSESIVERLLFKSGRPLLLCPEELATELPVALDDILIAWDHSAPAARAIADALPLLQTASSVRIITATDKRSDDELRSGKALVDHLVEHGIKASFETVGIDGSSVGKVFEAYVRSNRIDLLVMGAYRHSRLNEIIWGGATKTVIGRPPCWVMMSR